MNNVESIVLGLVLGLIVVLALIKFPGEPFDFTKAEEATPATNKSEIKTSATAEIEQAAQQVRVERLQELLGLEKQKVQELIEQAKQRAIEGDFPSAQESPTGKLVWLDRSFLALALVLLAAVLWWDYGLNVLHLLAYVFPREADALNKVFAVPFQVADSVRSRLEDLY